MKWELFFGRAPIYCCVKPAYKYDKGMTVGDLTLASCIITTRHIDAVLGIKLDRDDPAIALPGTKVYRVDLPTKIEMTHRKAFQSGAKSAFRKLLKMIVEDSGKDLKAFTIGSVGPLRTSIEGKGDPVRYGQILPDNVLRQWNGLNFRDVAKQVFEELKMPNVLIRIRPDCGLIALGEYYYRQQHDFLASENSDQSDNEIRDESVLAYLKFSREVNGGIVVGGQIWRGRRHSQFGVLHPQRALINGKPDEFTSQCKIHNNRPCIGGMVGTKAIEARLRDAGEGASIHDLDSSHPVKQAVASYIAQMCLNTMAILTPTLIVIGGRTVNDTREDTVEGQPQQLLEMVTQEFGALIDRSYESFDLPELHRVDGYIQPPINDLSGLYGGLIFGARQLDQQ